MSLSTPEVGAPSEALRSARTPWPVRAAGPRPAHAPRLRRGMRAACAVLATLAALAPCGCGALDELDQANAMMDTRGPQKPAGGSGPDEERPRKRLEWTNTRTLHADELDGRIVRCHAEGRTTFTTPQECRTRGGSSEGL